ncbi:MAG: hypothetical protein AB7N76_23040 [Planctomycetota bacterium]
MTEPASESPLLPDDPFEALRALPDLKRRTFRTPAAGKAARPFSVLSITDDSLEVRTSTGGRVTLRAEAFQAAEKAVGDLGAIDPDGWVPISDPTLTAVLQSENRDKACGSYVLPLLEALGRVALERSRPARVRLPSPSA